MHEEAQVMTAGACVLDAAPPYPSMYFLGPRAPVPQDSPGLSPDLTWGIDPIFSSPSRDDEPSVEWRRKPLSSQFWLEECSRWHCRLSPESRASVSLPCWKGWQRDVSP